MSGRRMDFDQRPELAFGSVDMLVPRDYWVQPSPAEIAAFASTSTSKEGPPPRTPGPIKHVFAIDVSFTASKTYMIQQAVRAIREALYPEPSEDGEANGTTHRTLVPGSKIAILTFDTTIHFYNLSPSLEQPQMMVVADLDDMFLPMYEGLLVDPDESRCVVGTPDKELCRTIAQDRHRAASNQHRDVLCGQHDCGSGNGRSGQSLSRNTSMQHGPPLHG